MQTLIELLFSFRNDDKLSSSYATSVSDSVRCHQCVHRNLQSAACQKNLNVHQLKFAKGENVSTIMAIRICSKERLREEAYIIFPSNAPQSIAVLHLNFLAFRLLLSGFRGFACGARDIYGNLLFQFLDYRSDCKLDVLAHRVNLFLLKLKLESQS